jgi:cytoskeletal protein RodZ
VNKLDSTQSEQLQAIGAYLGEIRQGQARTLEEIAARTYIPLRLLRAIEAGQSQILPEPVFVQGFIRRYADALGLDGWEIAQQFPVNNAATHLDAKPDYIDESLAHSTSEPIVVDAPLPKRFSMRRSRRSGLPIWGLGLGLALLAGGLYWLLSRSDAQPTVVADPSPAPADAEPPATATAPTPTTATVTPPSPSPSPNQPASASSPVASPSPTLQPSPAQSPAAPVTVDVNLTGDSWIQVIVDGQVALEETLPRGTRRRWNGREAVTIVAGNAGAVQVAFNNARAERMGELGAVEERTFTASAATNSPTSNSTTNSP